MECVWRDPRPVPSRKSSRGRLKRSIVQQRFVSIQSRVPELKVKVPGRELGVYTRYRQRLEEQWNCDLCSRRLDSRDRIKQAVTAAVVFSLSVSLPASSPFAMEIDRVSQVPVVEVIEVVQQVGDARQLVAMSAPEISSKVVKAVGSAVAAKPKAVPVMHPAVVSSGSRIIARVLQHFGGGGIAGAIGAALVYPLDTIKTRMQAQSSKKDCKYKNEIDCFRKLVADEGMGSLYIGLIPQLVGIAPEKALKLTVNELLLEMLEHVMPGTGLWFLELIAGSGGGFSQVVVTNPMEIVKVRLQTQSPSSDKKRGLREVVAELGFRGLYHGAGVTLARDIPSSGIFFACYAILRQLYPDQGFADGFLAAIPATVLSTPMDVVKTRLQMEVPEGESPHENAMACLKSVWEAEGPAALFKGSLARVLRTSPQFGVTLVVYNFICGSGS